MTAVVNSVGCYVVMVTCLFCFFTGWGNRNKTIRLSFRLLNVTHHSALKGTDSWVRWVHGQAALRTCGISPVAQGMESLCGWKGRPCLSGGRVRESAGI